MVKWTILIAAYTVGCIWLSMGRRSRLAGLLLGRRPRWCLLLLPVAAVAIELAGPNYGFSPSWWNIGWNLAAAAAVVLIVWRFPAGAADLAAAGLIALGLYGIALALSWPSAPFVTSYGKVVARPARTGGMGWLGYCSCAEFSWGPSRRSCSWQLVPAPRTRWGSAGFACAAVVWRRAGANVRVSLSSAG